MQIYKEEAGVISPEPCWVCIHNEYLYIGNTLSELIEVLNEEWESDEHLIS